MKEKRGLRRLLFVVLVVPLVGTLLGCALGATPQLASMEPPERAKAARAVALDTSDEGGAQWAGEDSDVTGTTGVDRKIIYDVTLDLIVKDTDAAFEQLRSLTQEMGGFVARSQMWRDEGYHRASVTVRVPVEKLDDALSQFRALAVDVENQSVDSEDVTESYVNLEARLRNEQRTEAELLELLESRSELGKTSDILEVHRELTQVRSRIEQLQGQMQYLDNLSAMATVQITLTPDVLEQPIVVAGWQPQGTARTAIRMLLRTLQGFVEVLIVVVLYVLPVVLVLAIPLAVLIFVGRAIWRRVKKHKDAKSA